MSVIFILLAASLGLGVTFLVAFLWATKSGQFDDTITPAMRILSEEEKTDSPSAKNEDEGGPRTL